MDSPAGDPEDVCCCGDSRENHVDGVGACFGLCGCVTFRLYCHAPPKRDREIEDEAYQARGRI